MADPAKTFNETAARLSKNPLGIIALFLVLVYSFAAIVAAAPSSITSTERAPIIYFLVTFPFVVLGLFGFIVIRYPSHLFSPGDFKNEANYVTLVASLTAASIRHSGAGPQQAIDIHK